MKLQEKFLTWLRGKNEQMTAPPIVEVAPQAEKLFERGSRITFSANPFDQRPLEDKRNCYVLRTGFDGAGEPCVFYQDVRTGQRVA
jgi:hypothetical protein